jgi:serine/threonine protein kinase
MEKALDKLLQNSGIGGSSSVEREPWNISEDSVKWNDYDTLGGVAHVMKGMMNEKQVACKKMVLKDQSSLDNFRREMSHATHLIHANLLHPIGGWYKFDPDTSSGAGYIIMELLFPLKTEDVFRLDDKTRLKHTSEVADGLAYMHGNGFTHRDIKPDNIMKDAEGRTKLIDFGLAKKSVKDNANRTRLTGAGEGTLAFMAPEIIGREEEGGDSKVDVYAFAMVTFEWWTNKRPWGSFTSDLQIVAAVKGGERPELPRMQYEMNVLVRECWAHSRDVRPKMEDVSDRLKFVLRGMSKSVEKKSKAVEKDFKAVEKEQDKLQKLIDELRNEQTAEEAKDPRSQDVPKIQGLEAKIEALKSIHKQTGEVEANYKKALMAKDYEAAERLKEQLKALGLKEELFFTISASIFCEFKRLGFITKGDYEDFKRLGLNTKADYDEFKLGGFTQKADYDDFQHLGLKILGFATKADYDKFKQVFSIIF